MDEKEKKNLTKKAVLLIDSFMEENYQFRRNVLSGKTEIRKLCDEESKWRILTEVVLNSMVRLAKSEGYDEQPPKTEIMEYIGSDVVEDYDPINDFLEHLPEWDGHNHVAQLFNRIPGLTSEQLGWCSTWLRSAVAHWMGNDLQHGNETVPVLIGTQGCGKTTFAVRLLPPDLRAYFLDHINFGNKFDSDMALTHNLLVNIDEFANMGPSQQGKLKHTLSRSKVNVRPIFGKSQEDRRRYASFIATTNDEHPLCDPTGSRRYLCLKVPKGMFIDNESPINYEQLYAQLKYEIEVQQIPFWFTNDEVKRIQEVNQPYFKEEDLEKMIGYCYRLPGEQEEGKWVNSEEVLRTLQGFYPSLQSGMSMKVKIGQALKLMGCASHRYTHGQRYLLVPLQAA